MRKIIITTALAAALPTAAQASPGLGNEVYGATVEKGEAEAEASYHALAGGSDSGEGVIQLEAAYSVSNRLRLGLQSEFEREPGDTRKAESLGLEAIYVLGKVGGVDVALYGEYEFGFTGPDKIETKLLLQRRAGPIDVRLNLIGEKPLKSDEKVELSYAFSADVETFDEVRLGVQAFGDLGTFDRLFPRAEHFAGPVAKFEIEGLGPELELQAGYLFALGKARDDTKGQLRLSLGLEF